MASAATPANVASVVHASNTFAFAMYKELCKMEEGKNMFFSPLSITAALAMIHLGAAGGTADEIKSTLNAKGFNDEDLHAAFSSLNQKLNTDEESACVLRLANRVFARKGMTVKENFTAATRKHYSAEAQVVDFANEPETSRTIINKWVEDQTNQKIKDLLKPDHIDDLTAMVLVNAIYFKGQWLDQFDPNETRKEPWILLSKEEAEVDMMTREASFRYTYFSEVDGTAYLEIPYKGKELSMGILLPETVDKLGLVQQKIGADSFENLASSKTKQSLLVTIPKFKMETQASLKNLLMTLGIKTAFQRGAADFSNIADSPNLYLSEVVHKAFVEVNEEGTEAAAATAAIIMIECMPEEFRADHPFMFFIKDNKTGAIIFMGHVMNPGE